MQKNKTEIIEKVECPVCGSDDIVVSLTRGDCNKIIDYVEWLEVKLEEGGYNHGDEYVKVQDSFQKIIDGKYKKEI